MTHKLFVLATVLMLCGAGCMNAVQNTRVGEPPVPPKKAEPVYPKPDVPKTPESQEGRLIPHNQFSSTLIYANGYERADCVGLDNADPSGGDLLTTLADDQAVRAQLQLKALTPEYARGLHVSIIAATSKEGNDFYAHYVCHLADGVDLVAGRRWPQGASTGYDTANSRYVTDFEAAKKELVLVKAGGARFFTDIQVQDGNATGGETSPCLATLEGKKIRWTCFQGLHFKGREPNQSTIESYQDWLLPLDGGAVIAGKPYEK